MGLKRHFFNGWENIVTKMLQSEFSNANMDMSLRICESLALFSFIELTVTVFGQWKAFCTLVDDDVTIFLHFKH